MPNTLHQLNKLIFLDINHNQLESLLETFIQLNRLVTFRISYNNLQYLPSDIHNIIWLEELSINNNQIKELPDSFSQLHLFLLDISNNPDIPSLPELSTIQLRIDYKQYRKFENRCRHIRNLQIVIH